MKTEPRHPFGELLAQYRTRKPGLTQTRLAELSGYDQAILVRMAQGKKDLRPFQGIDLPNVPHPNPAQPPVASERRGRPKR